jgi:hypothetical protein
MEPDSIKPKPKKKKAASKAVSIWANTKDRALFTRVAKRSGESFSKIVRVLVKRYDSTGTAKGLPTLAPLKKK